MAAAAPPARPQTPAGGLARPRVLEDPCPNCGEGVRRGLVRCWNFATFMRDDLAERYAAMQREAADTSFRPLREIEATAAAPSARRASGPISEEGDFELAGDFGDDAGGGDDDFSLTGELPAAPPLTGEFPAAPAAEGPADPAEPSADFAPEAPPAGDAAPVAESPDGETDGETDGEPAADPPPEPDVPHSEATGGDALLDIARQDEANRARQAPIGLRITADAFLLRCPAGHPIKVKRKHAGKIGRCPDPDCRLRYLVPDIPPDAPADDAPQIDATGDTDEQPTRDLLAAGAFLKWIDGPALHAIDPAKLDKVKRAPGSLAKTGCRPDLAFSPDTLLVLELKGKPGLLGLGGEKPAALREKAREHLSGDSPRITDLPCQHLVISAENWAELAVAYPPAYEHEAAFGDVPVFGEGRVVVQLPSLGGDDEPMRFLSMTLSEFRRLHAALTQLGHAEGFAVGTPVPLTDDPAEHIGHYTDATVRELARPDLYLADSALDTEISGYRCGACGLIVSEDGRKKEKLGGPKGKSLAKAKCPKCGDAFGEHPLYALKSGG